ncbi:uncharacterized protein LOC144234475 [Crocuta crocuta]
MVVVVLGLSTKGQKKQNLIWKVWPGLSCESCASRSIFYLQNQTGINAELYTTRLADLSACEDLRLISTRLSRLLSGDNGNLPGVFDLSILCQKVNAVLARCTVFPGTPSQMAAEQRMSKRLLKLLLCPPVPIDSEKIPTSGIHCSELELNLAGVFVVIQVNFIACSMGGLLTDISVPI